MKNPSADLTSVIRPGAERDPEADAASTTQQEAHGLLVVSQGARAHTGQLGGHDRQYGLVQEARDRRAFCGHGKAEGVI